MFALRESGGFPGRPRTLHRINRAPAIYLGMGHGGHPAGVASRYADPAARHLCRPSPPKGELTDGPVHMVSLTSDSGVMQSPHHHRTGAKGAVGMLNGSLETAPYMPHKVVKLISRLTILLFDPVRRRRISRSVIFVSSTQRNRGGLTVLR